MTFFSKPLARSAPKNRLGLLALASAFVVVVPAQAFVRLPAIISNHMVLQAAKPVPIWGWGRPGEKISVSFGAQTKRDVVAANGHWRVDLNPLVNSDQPSTLVVEGDNRIVVEDILVGEVWLASGQSNMEVGLHFAQNADAERAAMNYPHLRVFRVGPGSSLAPKEDCEGSWVACTPETAMMVSAVAYFFGRNLHQQLDRPVGMINASWGASTICAWTSESALRSAPELKPLLEKWREDDAAFNAAAAEKKFQESLAAWKTKRSAAKSAGQPWPARPSPAAAPTEDRHHPYVIFNMMIAPIIPYAMRGAIWYQGEHDTATEEQARGYYTELPLLIRDWRARWHDDFPFAWVQLPNLERKDYRVWVRDAMLQALTVKDTGMAVTIDIGEAQDNHPRNKQDVGARLSLWALGAVYHENVPATSGPLPAGNSVKDGELTLRFTHTTGGLVAHGGELRGFVVAGADHQWQPASARIDGDTVIVSSPQVPAPLAARYAWANNPTATLYNGAGLPASPFRTDDWAWTPSPVK